MRPSRNKGWKFESSGSFMFFHLTSTGGDYGLESRLEYSCLHRYDNSDSEGI